MQPSLGDEARSAIVLTPIGFVHSPFVERAQAPRQPSLAADVEATVELFEGRGFEDALEDLACWDHIWLITWFDRNAHGYRPKVRPPRSERKRGVFSTRAPYRPNPVGLSAVKLLSVEGRVLTIRGVDLLDRTPVLDIKPYVAYTDSIVDASTGWLDQRADPRARFVVTFSALAEEQLTFLDAAGAALRERLIRALELGPSPHAYRRIKPSGQGYTIAIKDFRAYFCAEATAIHVEHVFSGYRPRELHEGGAAPDTHRAFVARFGR